MVLLVRSCWVSIVMVIDSASSNARHWINVLILGVSKFGLCPWVDLSLHLGWLQVLEIVVVDVVGRATGLALVVGDGSIDGGRRV